MKTATYTIRGITPLLCHNIRLANPFDPMTRAIKTVTSKRSKTEDDLLEIARLEFVAGLYYDEDNGVHMPGYNMFASIIQGGKIRKMGTALRRAAVVQEDKIKLVYAGPKTPEELFNDKQFVDIRSVKVGTAMVTRCRPVFKEWTASFSVLYDESGLQRNALDQAVADAGAMAGIGDYRPRFGRFEVTEAK